MPMEWKTLLSPKRLGDTNSDPATDVRGFGRDYDRILYSLPFRRLLDKTQVFPMPANDHIHNRLIHSVEVSSVGRQLGVLAGVGLKAADVDLGGASPSDLGDIVASACLMHDIGNPPFGHAGEDAIASWFRGAGETHLETLSTVERLDLKYFEGNAQSFRIVSRLEMYGANQGGMRLTLATLGAVAKYPQASEHREKEYAGHQEHVARKKYCYFQDDKDAFRQVAEGLGLLSIEDQAWARHPLAYLVEAADDICYNILDLEDGYTLGLVTHDQIVTLLTDLLGESEIENNSRTNREHIAHLRSRAIGHLISRVSAKFNELYQPLLEGSIHESLVKLITPEVSALKEIKKTSKELCYKADEVVRVELAGYEVLGGLLEIFVPAALAISPDDRQDRALHLMHMKKREGGEAAYGRLLQVTDFLSGMTDSYALRLYRQLRGIELPSLQGRAPAG